ncbi:MAG: PLP-dependent lyase/thiolase [Chloracidobacterium sp.]|nr:PLP-dependent lyase/thiolase [Chloracidobacterium sp.]
MSLIAPTPLLQLKGVNNFRNLYVKDESVHPNGTFKDRLSWKAAQRYPKDCVFGVISYGNTAISLTRLIKDGNTSNEVVVFVPKGFETWTFGPSSLGSTIGANDILKELETYANVIPIEFNAGLLTDNDLIDLATEHNLNTKNFVNITEGIDIPAYVDIIIEVVEQLGKVPDVCIVPYGAGILCNELKDYLGQFGSGLVIPVAVASPNSMARMLFGPIWLDVNQLKLGGVAFSRHNTPDRTGAVRTPYPVFRVEEEEILNGLQIAEKFGISAEPSGAAGFGILQRLCQIDPSIDPENDLIVVINTGNGIDGFLRGNNK